MFRHLCVLRHKVRAVSPSDLEDANSCRNFVMSERHVRTEKRRHPKTWEPPPQKIRGDKELFCTNLIAYEPSVAWGATTPQEGKVTIPTVIRNFRLHSFDYTWQYTGRCFVTFQTNSSRLTNSGNMSITWQWRHEHMLCALVTSRLFRCTGESSVFEVVTMSCLGIEILPTCLRTHGTSDMMHRYDIW